MKMRVNDLSKFVLLVVLVGMILGVGLIVLDSFSVATRSDSSLINETVSLSTLRNEANGNVTEGLLNLANGYLKSVSSARLINDNGTTYLLAEGIDYSLVTAEETSSITFKDSLALSDTDDGLSGNNTEVLYVFKETNTASSGIGSTVDALIPIATTWLPLIVTIAVLAIILGLVIHSFGGFGSKRK